MKSFGGFEPFKSDVQPEAKIAAHLMAEGRYRFVIGTRQLGLRYEKKWSSQVHTSVRLLFPLVGGRVSHALIATLDLLIVAAPLFILSAGVLFGWSVHQVIAGVLWAGFVVLYATYLHKVWQHGWWLAAWFWTVAVIQEAVLLLVSAWQYKRGKVNWKGRPVMLSAQSATHHTPVTKS